MKNKSIKITGATIAPNSTMSISYKEVLTNEHANEVVTTNNDIKIKSDRIAHDDLMQGFRELNFHLAILTEQFRNTPETEEFVNHVMSRNLPEADTDELKYCQDVLERTFCTGLVIKKDGQAQTVTLEGVRLLSSGSIELKSPALQIHTSGYRFLTEFKLAVDDVKDECEKYLDGKCKESNQIDMFPEDGLETTVSFGYTNEDGEKVETNAISVNALGKLTETIKKKSNLKKVS